MAQTADASRYARAESAVFDLSFASFRAHSRRPQIKTVLTIELLILIYYFFLIRLASLATHGMAIFVAMIIMPSIVFFVLAIAALLATRELYGQSAIAANRRGSYQPPLCVGLQLDGSRSCLEGYSDTLTHALMMVPREISVFAETCTTKWMFLNKIARS